jgi:hypothetical protein
MEATVTRWRWDISEERDYRSFNISPESGLVALPLICLMQQHACIWYHYNHHEIGSIVVSVVHTLSPPLA